MAKLHKKQEWRNSCRRIPTESPGKDILTTPQSSHINVASPKK
jgi:hypothetical protein